jgi:hypothetical protein
MTYDKFQCILLNLKNINRHYFNFQIKYINKITKQTKTILKVCTY